jgi:DNA-binding NarL/FixJ family response regulator
VQTKIMIINADASMTVRLAGQLKRFGYNVTHFMKPTGAVDAVMSGRPDWLVLDIDQPQLNVVGFCELVQRAPSINKLRVLLCSSADELSARELVRRCGARGFISKDQPIESMAAKIDGFTRKPQSMMPAAEVQRLAAVRSYAILDTPPEEDFDSLTRRASHICGTPIALMSIVDRERQWFKSKVGITASEMPRAIAFCAHAIHDRSVFEVPDAMRDERFSANPLVLSSPNIRFYAGAPIVTPSGDALGALCVIDTKPRDLSASQRDTLKTLSRQVMHLLELRQLRGMSERRPAGGRLQSPLQLGDVASHQLLSQGYNRGSSGAR